MKILIAIDDSEFGEFAVRQVAAQNKTAGNQLRLLTVVEPITTASYAELAVAFGDRLATLQKQRMAAAAQMLARAAKKLRTAGFRVSTQVREGQVRSEIIEAAQKWKAHLIVVGSHGRSRLDRILLGSVSEYVARHASCSVEIVRMP
jgi:nucleotide-binding universal stress UspA family protein